MRKLSSHDVLATIMMIRAACDYLGSQTTKSLSFSSAANLKYQFRVINEGQCV